MQYPGNFTALQLSKDIVFIDHSLPSVVSCRSEDWEVGWVVFGVISYSYCAAYTFSGDSRLRVCFCFSGSIKGLARGPERVVGR